MRLLALLSIGALLATPAHAGKNANGSLIVHTNDANGYTVGVCARFDAVDDPGSCEAAGTQTNKPEDQPALIWLIAYFCPNANPGVVVIYFGLDHNLPQGLGYFDRWGLCGPAGSLEIPDAGWPETGGNSVAFGSPIVGDTRFPFYYLNVYGFAGAYLGTGINPTGGYAAFVDDSNPPIQDNIYNFGTVRWGTPGQNPCGCDFPIEACCFGDGHCEDLVAGDCTAAGGIPQGLGTTCATVECPQPEACCFADCTCQDLLPDDCIAMGGAPMGPGTDCASFQCDCPPYGACCLPDGSCQWIFDFECEVAGGMFYGIGSRCEEVECPPVATETSTWGRIKADYR